MLAQEHVGGVVEEDDDEQVVAETETVVTEVIVIVDGGIVGHVVGGVVLEELDVDVEGGLVATQEQALEIFAAEEEQGLAKAG
jgi:hypothetical protein